MMLEAILRRLYNIDALALFRYTAAEELLNVLLEVHPKKPEKPKRICPYWDKNRNIMFTFEYKDKNKNRDLTYDELYQYFCTVLGEKEC